MAYCLDANIVESIRKGENERVIMKTFEGAYGGVEYPPKNVYRTLLCCRAVSFDHKDLVRYLLETGYDVNYNFGYVTPSPLNVAVHLGREECIKMLLNAGARVDMENRFSDEEMTEVVPALELAVMMDRKDLVKLMIPLYDRTKTRTQRTPLHLACLHGARQCLDYILSTVEGQNDVNSLDSDDPRRPEKYSPLMLGLHQGAWLVQRILQAGGNAKHITERLKCTVLHIACSSGLYMPYRTHGFVPPDLPEIIQLLVEAGCDPNINSARGETPVSRLCTQVASELKTPQDKPFPYDVAIHREVVLRAISILLKHGANPDGNIRDIPLSVLISQLSMLLQQFACIAVDPAVQEIYVPSAFQAMILTRDLFRLLLLRGANPNIIDSHGRISRFIVDSLFVVLLNNRSGLMGIHSQWIADIVGIIADVFRLLLLFGGKLHEPTRVFQVFLQNIPEGSLFLTYYLNFCGRPHIELQMKRVQVLLKNTNETRVAELRDFIQRQPILLMHLARIAILRSVGSQAVRSVPSLKLPEALTDYILSLK